MQTDVVPRRDPERIKADDRGGLDAGPPLRVYWFKKRPNFGDILSPRICATLSGRQVEYCDDFSRCELVAIGSVVQHIDAKTFTGFVWGAGLISQPPAPVIFDKGCIRAVRGRLTAKALGVEGKVPLGDPGLLASRYARPTDKQPVIGLVPHFVDRDEPLIRRLAAKPNMVLIDIESGIENVIDQISRCEGIVSSGLHALVLADALGIPNAWMRLSDRVIGEGFKFRDYYSVFGIEKPRPLWPGFPSWTLANEHRWPPAHSLPSAPPPRSNGFSSFFEDCCLGSRACLGSWPIGRPV